MKNLILTVFFFLATTFHASSATQLIVDQDYLPTLLKLLSSARQQVDVMAFSFAIDEGGVINDRNPSFLVAKKLLELKARGVRIRLFIEGNRDTSQRNKITADFLASSGVEVRFGATHAKGFSIDKKIILFGSTNLTTQSMIKNNETNILTDDSSTAIEFSRFYENLWFGGAHGSIQLRHPMIADGIYKMVLLNMIKSARRSIEFSIYYFNDTDIERALILANARGVVITGFVNQHRSFGLELVARNKETVRRLREAGLKNLHFDIDSFFSHSKYLIKDQQEILMGTGNWNNSDVNEHRQLYIHLINPILSKQLSAHLGEQIRTESDPRM